MNRSMYAVAAALIFFLGVASSDVIPNAHAASEVVRVKGMQQIMTMCDFSKSVV